MPLPPSDNTNDKFPVTPALTDELATLLVQILCTTLDGSEGSTSLTEVFDLTQFMRDKVLVAHNFITKDELEAPSLVINSLIIEELTDVAQDEKNLE